MTGQDTAVETTMGVRYSSNDGTALLGDLYKPAGGNGRLPVLIGVHGGGWRGGDRSSYGNWGRYLASHGYAFFAVQYRLAKDSKSFPGALHDIFAAVRLLRERAGDFDIDPERIALLGNSSGAHLAALAALTADRAVFPQEDGSLGNAKVKACVCAYGMYDLAAQWNYDLVFKPRNQITEKFLGAALIDDRRTFFEASPLSYVTADNNKVAFYLTYGQEDDAVDYRSQSEAFRLALNQAGFYVRSAVVPGAGHYWMSDPIEDPLGHTAFVAPRILRFLAERL